MTANLVEICGILLFSPVQLGTDRLCLHSLLLSASLEKEGRTQSSGPEPSPAQLRGGEDEAAPAGTMQVEGARGGCDCGWGAGCLQEFLKSGPVP